jgi:hypothetical protein
MTGRHDLLQQMEDIRRLVTSESDLQMSPSRGDKGLRDQQDMQGPLSEE